MYYLYLINPFIALLAALSDLRQKHAKNIIWLFVIFIGITWALRPDMSADSVRYIDKLKLFYNGDYGFFEYYELRNDVDFFSLGMTYILSRFTDYGYALIILQSIVFGYFFSRNMAFVMDKCEGKIKGITYILFFCFFLTMPMWSFNGFRFNLTTHIFVYGLLQYFFEKKKKGLVWCFVSPFVFHYAFILPAALLGLYLVFRDRVNIYFGIFIFSLFFAEFDSTQFNKLVETYAPASFEEKSEAYRKDSSFEKLEESSSAGVLGGKQSWHAALYKKSIFWSMYIFLIYFYFRRKKLMQLHPNFVSILSFVLLFFSVANFMMNVPSGVRYSVVASLFTLSFTTIYIQNATFDNLGARISKWLAPVLLFYIIVSARTGFFYLSLTTIVGNPIIALFTIGENINLDLLIK